MAVKVDTSPKIIFGSADPNVSRALGTKDKNFELHKVATLLIYLITTILTHR